MKRESIRDLECPRIINGRKCQGALELKVLTQKGSEILDGFLTCQGCKIKYPVIGGIPILLDNLKRYLKNNFTSIITVVKNSHKIHKELLLYILTSRYSIFKKEKKKDEALFGPAHVQADVGDWFLLHYGGLDKATHTPLLNDLIKLHKRNNAYEIVKRWLSKKNLRGKKSVDVGCNTGGLTYLLATTRSSFSYGVDISYEGLFKAARVIKNIPSKLNWYKISEGGRLKTKKIDIEKKDNVDFILASADNLPFKNEAFDISLSSSVLDIAGNNIKILKEAQRTLKKQGEVFVSFVPLFRGLEESKKKEMPLTAQNVKKTAKHIRFYREFSHLPFLIRNSENFYNVYDNYCMIGKKVK